MKIIRSLGNLYADKPLVFASINSQLREVLDSYELGSTIAYNHLGKLFLNNYSAGSSSQMLLHFLLILTEVM